MHASNSQAQRVGGPPHCCRSSSSPVHALILSWCCPRHLLPRAQFEMTQVCTQGPGFLLPPCWRSQRTISPLSVRVRQAAADMPRKLKLLPPFLSAPTADRRRSFWTVRLSAP